MSVTENVKVAVRVRPFNNREIERKTKCVISMNGNVTSVSKSHDSSEKPLSFTYDYSYWSHDGCKEDNAGYYKADPTHPNGSKFSDQNKVFDDLGQGILKNAWDGYNSTLFAYGQTGSGKSWSTFGVKPNDGLVPIFCREMFKAIDAKKTTSSDQCEVSLTMLEIYNEQVRDLLNRNGNKGGLKVRETAQKAFYAEGLTLFPVASCDSLLQKIEEGKTNRSIAATKMNDNSSRAHTIVGITLRQKCKDATGTELAKTAVINLVDLAGSERIAKSEATGSILKEGAAINQSLTNLGICIHTLAEGGAGKVVPYRNSVLTKLLANALGGNSKTIMIAAISPADWNYDETISTLRYADSAKRIKTVATVNSNPTEKLIAELRAENDRLKKCLDSGKLPSTLMLNESGQDVEQVKKKCEEELKAVMAQNDLQIAEMKKSFQEKLQQAEQEKGCLGGADFAKIQEEKKTKPHLSNLNFDPQLAGRIVHILNKGASLVGCKKGTKCDIIVLGPSILDKHCTITCSDKDECFLEPFNEEARVLYNGDLVTKKTCLHHNDRILFGATQLYIFGHPKQRDTSGQTYPAFDYTMAQEEIARKAGVLLPSTPSGSSPENALLQEDLLGVLPAVQEANCISSELDRRVKFEIILLPAQLICSEVTTTQVCVKMRNLENGQEFVWHKEKFLNRLYMMKEMYAKFDDDDAWELPEDEDPFTESPDTEVHIGSTQVFLQPLAYMVDMKETLEVTDYKGNETGLVNVEISPCNKEGKIYGENDDMFVDKPEELIGRNVYFMLKITSVKGLPNRYTDISCKYRFFNEAKDSKTSPVNDINKDKFNYTRILKLEPATKEEVVYLRDGFFILHVVGKQQLRKSAMVLSRGKSTREMLKNDHGIMSGTKSLALQGGFNFNGRMVDPQKQSIIVELLLMKKQQARLHQKLEGVKKLVDKSSKMGRKTVPLSVMKDVMNAYSVQAVDKALMQLEGIPDEPTAGMICSKPQTRPLQDNNKAKSCMCVII